MAFATMAPTPTAGINPSENLLFSLLLLLLLSALGCSNTNTSEQPTPSQSVGQNPAPSDSGSSPATEVDTTASNSGPMQDGNAETDNATPVDFEGTDGVVDRSAHEHEIALLREVRSAKHGEYDRVVFEFDGSTLPGYHVEYIDSPVRKCGSGAVTSVAGDAWLEIRMHPANAHTDTGQPTVSDRERHVNNPVLKELEMTCDFEGYVSWVLGVSAPNRYRVLELTNPARLVLDVKH